MTNIDDNYPNDDNESSWDDPMELEMSNDEFEDTSYDESDEIAFDEPLQQTPSMNESSEQTIDEESLENGAWFESEPGENEEAVAANIKDRRGKTANRNTMILICASLAAVVGIYFLGQSHKTTEQDSIEQQTVNAQLDMALNRLMTTQNQQVDKDGITDNERLMQAFYQYAGTKQLALSELNCNPFHFVSAAVTRTQSDEERIAMNRRASRLQELTSVFNTLDLEGILISPGGSQCMVNGEVFNLGDNIREDFKIEDITQQQILLIAEQTEFILQM